VEDICLDIISKNEIFDREVMLGSFPSFRRGKLASSRERENVLEISGIIFDKVG